MSKVSLACEDRYRQCPFYRSNTTIQRKFAHTKNVNQVRFFCEVAICTQDSQRDRQIEASAFFSNVSRREVDRGSLKRKEVLAVLNRCSYAFTRFANCSIG